jgi:hypothetical protein
MTAARVHTWADVCIVVITGAYIAGLLAGWIP